MMVFKKQLFSISICLRGFVWVSRDLFEDIS